MVLTVAVAGKRNCFLQYFFSFMQMHVPLSSSFLLLSGSSPLDLGSGVSFCQLFILLFSVRSFFGFFSLSLSSGSLLPSLFGFLCFLWVLPSFLLSPPLLRLLFLFSLYPPLLRSFFLFLSSALFLSIYREKTE